ncbi:glutamyl-tRNA reductase [Desulfococcaceae bacterium HSG8]|nr:glutamyl-tRNA reductase [Desulfococcaceae bacterium HSG8]
MKNLPNGNRVIPFSPETQLAMPEIILLGLNHKTAPVELRECLAFSGDETEDALSFFQRHPNVREMVIISTCNRVEILMAADNRFRAVEAARTYISESKDIPASQFEASLYVYYGDEAVRHIFKVASSLDSMVVGEPQILGQVKTAYKTATAKKTSGVVLNRLFHKTFSVAKRVRTETGIGDNAVSISYAAIELGRKIFGKLEGKKVLLVGAGEMAELAVEHLIRNRIGDIFVANRTFERGLGLAKRFNGKAVRFEEISDCLRYTDIIISSTGSPEFVIRREHVKGQMRGRKNRPLFFIDIAVPRDIDPEINRIPNVYVYDIDDLKGVIDENIEDRNREALRGERIIDEAVISYRQWYESLDVVPTIVALRKKMDAIAKTEVRKTLNVLKAGHGGIAPAEEDCQAVCRMADALVNKILHDPTLFLKGDGCHGDKSLYLDVARKLFKLDD